MSATMSEKEIRSRLDFVINEVEALIAHSGGWFRLNLCSAERRLAQAKTNINNRDEPSPPHRDAILGRARKRQHWKNRPRDGDPFETSNVD